jgi:hypothetical protein
MTGRITGTGICYGMEMNVKNTKNLNATIPNTDYD